MLEQTEIVSRGERVFNVEIDAMNKVRDSLGDAFANIVAEILDCNGKLVITGMGKPGHIARKLAATFSSLGTPAFFLHPGEAMHGDLGMLDSRDIVIAISYSGESDEIVGILPNIKMIRAKLIAITGNGESTLAKYAEITQVLPQFEEACHLGLAPTSSTTAALAYGDALAVVVSEITGFQDIDFGKRHPAGSLGKRLVLHVDDLMAQGPDMPTISIGQTLLEAVEEISRKRLGSVAVVSENNRLVGIITDGDVRRAVKSQQNLYTVKVEEVMTSEPKTTSVGEMAYNALLQIRENNINCLPVVDGGRAIGMITWQSIVKAGIVL